MVGMMVLFKVPERNPILDFKQVKDRFPGQLSTVKKLTTKNGLHPF
jgi:hypothetical protein